MTTTTIEQPTTLADTLRRLIIDEAGKPTLEALDRCYDDVSLGLSGLSGVLMDRYLPANEIDNGSAYDLRPSEQQWVDELRSQMVDAAEAAAIEVLIDQLRLGLPSAPTTLREHPAAEQLRADLAILEAGR